MFRNYEQSKECLREIGEALSINAYNEYFVMIGKEV